MGPSFNKVIYGAGILFFSLLVNTSTSSAGQVVQPVVFLDSNSLTSGTPLTHQQLPQMDTVILPINNVPSNLTARTLDELPVVYSQGQMGYSRRFPRRRRLLNRTLKQQQYLQQLQNQQQQASSPQQMELVRVYPTAAGAAIDQMQPAMSMSVGRIGRSPYDMARSRASSDDEVADDGYNYAGYEEDQQYKEDDHEPIAERRKPKKKKKKEDSFPKRIFKKTKNAISSTTKAVFGAPKYIYTRYKEAWVGGKGKKKKSDDLKGQGWGWKDEGHGHGHDDGASGWGWERRSASDDGAADDYERKQGKRSSSLASDYNKNYRYNKYSYKQPSALRDASSARSGSERLLSLASLNSWAG